MVDNILEPLVKRKFMDGFEKEPAKKLRSESTVLESNYITSEIDYEGTVVYKTHIFYDDCLKKSLFLYYLNKEYQKFTEDNLLADFLKKTTRINEDELAQNKNEFESILLPGAVKKNNILYYYYLGRMFTSVFRKTNMPEDANKALKYLEISKNNGIINAYLHLTLCYFMSKDYKKLNLIIDSTLKYDMIMNSGALLLYELTCKYYLHIKKDCEHSNYNVSLNILKNNNSSLYYFYNAHIYKNKDPEKFIELLHEGVIANCLKSTLLYGQIILNKFVHGDNLSLDKLSEAILCLEKCMDNKMLSQNQAHDFYHKIVGIHYNLGNLGYQIFYLEKIFDKYKCIRAGTDLINIYCKKNNIQKVLEYEIKLIELNFVPAILNQIIRCKQDKNFPKYIDLLFKLKKLDSREYLKHMNYLSKIINTNRFKVNKYLDNSFECPIILENVSDSLILSCCKKEIGCWFLLSGSHEFNCPYCRFKFKI